MYRGIYDTSILCINGSFANKMCCGLTALFVKPKINFCPCKFANKQTTILNIVFLYRNIPENISENFCSFGNGAPN